MKRILSVILFLAMVISLAPALPANAAEEVFYTLAPATGSNNAYYGNCDVAISGITWNVSGNALLVPWRLGGKSITGVDREVYSKTAVADTITKVELDVGTASSITVNSLSLVVASDADFANVISTVSGTFAASSTITFEHPSADAAWSNAYYKFIFNVTVSGTSNKFVQFSEARFYRETGAPACTHENTTLTGAVAATCTTDGYTGDYICDDCGATVTAGSVIPATGHTYIDGVCSVCGADKGTPGWYLVDVYTKLEDGIYAIISPNNYAFNGTISSGHGQKTAEAFAFDASGYAAAAPSGTLELTLTSTANGFTLYNAEKGYLYASKAASGGLAFHESEDSGWSFSADGGLYAANNAHLRSYNDSFRTYSGNSNATIGLAYKVVNSCTHNWVAGSTVLPTCTEDGYTPYTCSLCNETKQDDIVPALGHNWVAGTTVAPTCTEDGYTVYTCSRCNETKQDDVVPAPGHTYVDGVCSVCGAEEPAYLLTTSLKDGDEVIIYNASAGKAMSEDAIFTHYRAGVEVPVNDNKIVTDNSKIVWTVTASGSGFTFANDAGETLSATSYLSYASTDNIWTIDRATTAYNVYLVNNTAVTSDGGPRWVEWYAKYNEFSAFSYYEASYANFDMQLFVRNSCSHANTTLTDIAPTCTLQGVAGGVICEDCGAIVMTGTVIPATGHSFIDGYCSVCGAMDPCFVTGTCGSDLNWLLDLQSGELEITGTGEIPSWGSSSFAPWYTYRSSITSVSIDNGVTSIGNFAFSGCSELTSVTIPDSVTSIGVSAFSGCSGLTSITIPDSVTSIGDHAFSGCEELTGITIPDSVTSIGAFAFSYCSGLTSVTIPDSVTWIGGSAFWDCRGMNAVYITDIAAWCRIMFNPYSSYHFTNPLAFAHDLYLNETLITDLVIPDCVTSIQNDAFYGCSSLTSVTIPGSVTSIGNYAFQNCTGLTDVYYFGSEAGWNRITIGSNNTPLTGATIHYLAEGLAINTASLTLYEDIVVNFTATVPEGLTDPYMVVELGEQSYTLAPSREDDQGRLVFEFMNLTPDKMGDNIKATLYAYCDGTLVEYCKPEYSVKQYCTNVMAAYPDDAKLQTLLSDILVYGAATQRFTGHNADALVTDGLTLDTASAFEDLTSTDFGRTGTQDADIQWTGAGLECGSRMSMYFTLNTTIGEATSVEVTINGRTTVYSYSDMTVVDENDFGATCRVVFRGISASEYGDVVTAVLKNNGEQVGQTLTYSVNSYVYSKQHDTNTANLAQLVRAIYNYGKSAKNYLN